MQRIINKGSYLNKLVGLDAEFRFLYLPIKFQQKAQYYSSFLFQLTITNPKTITSDQGGSENQFCESVVS